jgi:D-alanine transaminase
MIVYLNGDFIPREEASISPDDRGFLFADGVYEVVFSYEGYLFREASHWARLKRSLGALRITGLDDVKFGEICRELIRRNNLEGTNASIYLQVTRGAAPRNHPFPPADTKPTIYAFVRPQALPTEVQMRGCTAITLRDERWLRCDIKAISLLPNILAKQAAVEAGAYESILVRDGNITEGSSTGFAAVFDNQLFTAPLNHLILPSITREVVLELCGKLGIRITQDPVPEAGVFGAYEAMIFSTNIEVVPVVEINGHAIGSGQRGPITQRLQEAFRLLVSQDRALGV